MTTDIGHFNQIYIDYGDTKKNIFDEVWIAGKTRSLLNIILQNLRGEFIQV